MAVLPVLLFCLVIFCGTAFADEVYKTTTNRCHGCRYAKICRKKILNYTMLVPRIRRFKLQECLDKFGPKYQNAFNEDAQTVEEYSKEKLKKAAHKKRLLQSRNN